MRASASQITGFGALHQISPNATDKHEPVEGDFRGDVQAERFRVSIINFENALINSWGRRNGYSEELPVPSYSELVSMKAAVADWSRIRPVLKDRLSTAQSALTAFEKNNF